MPSSKKSACRVCPFCGKIKPGWPDEWANGFMYSDYERTLYVCADCFDEHKTEAKAQTATS